MAVVVLATGAPTSSLPPSAAAFRPDADVGGGGGTTRLAGARLGIGGAAGPVAGAGEAGRGEGAKGDDDIFPRICDAEGACPGDGDVARAILTGAGDPVRDRLRAGLVGRELGGSGIADAERRERGRGAGDDARAVGVGEVGVAGSGTV